MSNQREVQALRCAKFWGLDTKELEDDFKKTIQTYRRISHYLRDQIKTGEIVNISRFPYNITKKDGTVVTDSAFTHSIDHLFDCDKNFRNQSVKRSCVHHVLERYAGYCKRNGENRAKNIKAPISFKDKSYYFKDAYVHLDDENQQFLITTLYTDTGEFRKVPYAHSLKTKNVYDQKPKKSKRLPLPKFGGNLMMNQGSFSVGILNTIPVVYTPKCFIGFDLNKDEKSWIWFSDGSVIIPNPKISKLIKEIKTINKSLDGDKKLEIKKRRVMRYDRRKARDTWKKLHTQLTSEITKICNEIILKAKKTEALLCIDSVKTGQKLGTFGQDKVIPTLQTMCENQGIPFYVVPCKDTSRRCSDCGHISPKNRTNTDDFKCVKCGYECNAQQNGADNIAFQGNRLLDAGVPFANWTTTNPHNPKGRRRSVDSLVKEYSNQ